MQELYHKVYDGVDFLKVKSTYAAMWLRGGKTSLFASWLIIQSSGLTHPRIYLQSKVIIHHLFECL